MDNIKYEYINADNYEAAADCLSLVFFNDEPVTNALGLDFQRYKKMVRMFARVIGTKGLSYVAIDTKNITTAGVITNIDLMIDFGEEFSGETENFDDVLEGLAPDINMTSQLTSAFIKKMNFAKGKCINLFQCAVLPEYSRSGIASGLVDLSLKNAVIRGYEYALVTCTSERSKSIFDKLNFTVENEIVYKDFVLNGIKYFEKLDGRYTLMVKKIGS